VCRQARNASDDTATERKDRVAISRCSETKDRGGGGWGEAERTFTAETATGWTKGRLATEGACCHESEGRRGSPIQETRRYGSSPGTSDRLRVVLYSREKPERA
jgi:hypothetical protein